MRQFSNHHQPAHHERVRGIVTPQFLSFGDYMTFFMLHILGRVISAIVDPGKHFRIRTPGRRLRRRLESSTSVTSDPLLRKQTEQSVSTAMCESGDCFLVRTSTTAYAFSILLDLQFRLNLHLIPVFSTLTNGGRVSAFILTANIPPNSEYVSLFMREYILNCSLNLALCEPSHLISFQQNIIPRICHFPSLEREHHHLPPQFCNL